MAVEKPEPSHDSRQQDRELRKVDLRPEYIHYKDTGCEFAPSCLDCPFPRCVYQDHQEDTLEAFRKRQSKASSREQIGKLYHEGKSTLELASIFKMSQRQIQRIIKKGGS